MLCSVFICFLTLTETWSVVVVVVVLYVQVSSKVRSAQRTRSRCPLTQHLNRRQIVVRPRKFIHKRTFQQVHRRCNNNTMPSRCRGRFRFIRLLHFNRSTPKTPVSTKLTHLDYIIMSHLHQQSATAAGGISAGEGAHPDPFFRRYISSRTPPPSPVTVKKSISFFTILYCSFVSRPGGPVF